MGVAEQKRLRKKEKVKYRWIEREREIERNQQQVSNTFLMPVICLKNYYLAYDFRIELAENITELPQKERSKISKKNLKQLIFKNIYYLLNVCI